MTRPVPPQAVDLVTRYEGKVLKAYPDPASGGIPYTIGYGHVRGVRPGQLINESQALNFLRADLADAADKLEGKIGPVVSDLTSNQYAALLSFVFNLGTGDPADREWKIWAMLRARKFEQIPGQLARFVNAGGRRMQGLANRRSAEIALWRTGEPGTVDENPSSAVTRLMDTPPTPGVEAPARKNPGVLATAGAAIMGTVAAAKDWLMQLAGLATPDHINTVIGAATPYAQQSHLVAQAIQGLAAFAALVAVVFVVRSHNQAKS